MCEKNIQPLLMFNAVIQKKSFTGQKGEDMRETVIYGDTVAKILDKIWEESMPYLVRRAVVQNGRAWWHEKETPTREDLDLFVVVSDKTYRKTYAPSKLNEKLIKQFKARKIFIYVLIFSIEIKSMNVFKIMEAQLLGTDVKNRFNESSVVHTQLLERDFDDSVQSKVHDFVTSSVPELDIDLKEEYCRICLDTIKTVKFTLTKKLRIEYLYLINAALDESPDLSQIICANCYMCLRNSFKFKAVCVENQKKLLKKFYSSVFVPDKPESCQKRKFSEPTEIYQPRDNEAIQIPAVFIKTEELESKIVVEEEKESPVENYSNFFEATEPVIVLKEEPETYSEQVRVADAEEEISTFFDSSDQAVPAKNDQIQKLMSLVNVPREKVKRIKKSFSKRILPRKEKIKMKKPPILKKTSGTLVKDVECDYCGKLLSLKSLETHINAIHLRKKIHLCTLCGYKTAWESGLIKHMERHTENSTFKCEECSKLFKSKYLLKNHQQGVHEKRYMVICQHCGIELRNKTMLNQHVLKAHKIGIEDVPRFSCDICGYECIFKSYMKTHIQKIHCSKPEICSICGMSVKRMQSHLETHQSVYRYKCTELLEDGTPCKKTLRNSNRLNFHIQTFHRKIFSHECNRCHRFFRVKKCLNEHILAEHMNLQLKCLIIGCRTKFRTIRALCGHIKVVHRELSEEEKLNFLKMAKEIQTPKVIN